MTTEPTKKRTVDRHGPLDEFTIASRVCRILEAQATDDAEIEKTIRDAQAKKKRQRQAEITGLFMRGAEDRRQAASDLVVSRRLPLCGFELYAPGANDSTVIDPGEPGDFPPSYGDPPPDDGIPERLKTNVPPAERIEKDRETGAVRRVGPGRT